MASQFGEGGEGEHGGEWVALPAALAPIRHGVEVGGEGLQTEDEREVVRELERKRQYGRVHGTPSLRMSGY